MTKTLERDAAKVLLARGYSISKVARLVGVTWPTAAKATQPYSTPNLPRKPRSCSLAPFRADIERELAAKGTTCTELFGILSRSGFTGSLRTVQRYVRRTSHANPEGSQTGGTSWATWLSSTDHGWMLRLTQASFLGNALADDLGKSLEPHEAAYILKVMREGRLTARNRIALCANMSGTLCLSSIRVAGGEEHPS